MSNVACGNPLVSIVIITYNSSKFILETLESCKNQDYKNIELILSDDSSTDNTLEVYNKWINKNGNSFKSYKLITSKLNTGIAANVNRGVLGSSGKWFKLLAGDDLLTEDCISYNVKQTLLIGKECNIYNTIKNVFINENGKKKFLNIKGRTERREIFFNSKNQNVDQLNLAVRYIRPAVNGHFIKKSMFVKIGMCDLNFPMHEDSPLLINILNSGYRIYGDNHVTVLYRKHGNSVFQSESEAKIYTDWHFISNIPMIKTYYFPYFNKLEKLAYYYSFMVAQICVKFRINRRTILNKSINKILLLPFQMVFNINQKMIINKIKNNSY